jgi:hypothetical protein
MESGVVTAATKPEPRKPLDSKAHLLANYALDEIEGGFTRNDKDPIARGSIQFLNQEVRIAP